MNNALLSICYECDQRQHPCHGTCLCNKNGRDITRNIRNRDCPMNKFDGAKEGIVERISHQMKQPDRDEDCGCC